MRVVLVAALAAVLVVSGLAQNPKIEGVWYGVINPGGTPLDIALSFQKQGNGWTGTLIIENDSIPLKNITATGNAISFSIEPPGRSGQAAVVFNAKLAGNGSELSGEFTQGRAKSPFKLGRTPTPNLRSADAQAGIDPNELLEMMTSFSGPLSDRPFVPPTTYPAIEYGIRPPRDPVANLVRDIQDNKVQLKFDGENGYLRSLLDALKVPVESQMAVFSKTSVQGAIIGPSNPRRLYFNDSVAVGIVGGGFIELAAQDPEQGMSFYMMPQQPGDKPFIIKRDECLKCHLSRNSLDIPGMLVRSVYPASSGTPMNQLGSHLLDHRTPLENRWGGWYITGSAGSMKHLGNAAFTDGGEPQPIAVNHASDIVAAMVFDHQMYMMNLITRVGWDFRIVSSLEQATAKRSEAIHRQLRDEVNEFVDYLLFVDEAPLTGRIQGGSGFAEKFAAMGPADSKGRSLRQFDLEHRLMRYPCSYMIYAPAFDALPAEAKEMIYARMLEVLSSRFSSADRQAVIEILRATKKDLPREFN
jgi:hypothetical protein